MAMSTIWVFLLLVVFSLSLSCQSEANGDQKVYIAYMGGLPEGDLQVSAVHTNMIQAALGSRASGALLHSYKRSFNGFAAIMTENEMRKISIMDGVVAIFPNEKIQLHTTRSWDFIGFPENVSRSTTESDVIVAMFDTGIWPESKSFDDSGYGPPPAKFKGSCQSSANFTCNNKIIGARFYRARADGNFSNIGDIASPRDINGHGTHTSSTAAGRLVSDASLYDLAKGTARGGVPSARIAVYKMCWPDGCFAADLLAAFDDAIADGVDIISLSGGWKTNPDYFNDPIAIGAFHAMKNGILTSTSAGNGGPNPKTTGNVAPWLLTVAANLIDRSFITDVVLGDNTTLEGVSLNTFQPENKMYPLVYGGTVANSSANFTQDQAGSCALDSLDKAQIEGKIVLCNLVSQDVSQSVAGSAGVVISGTNSKDSAISFPIPASFIGLTQGGIISNYINTTSEPTCTIQKSREGIWVSAPFVPSFSSRGPNSITMDILKPDLSAPGVDILAAWSDLSTVSELFGDTRVTPYNILSGSSMACPHATGAAAYVKSINPTWSPAAIKSALMTTAKPMSMFLNIEAEFAYGSGQIDPVKALNPGLVYDLGVEDYVSFLCGQGINNTNVQLITGDNSTTCSEANMTSVWDLNYPSFVVSGTISGNTTQVFHRTVTNVGSAISTYKANVASSNPNLLKIQVEPDVLSFETMGQKQSFKVTVSAKTELFAISGSLIWDDGVYQVRSPIVAHGYV